MFQVLHCRIITSNGCCRICTYMVWVTFGHSISPVVHMQLPPFHLSSVHILLCSFIQTCSYTSSHTRMSTPLHYRQIYICTYIRTYIHRYIHTYLPTYIHIYIHTYILTYLHTYIHTQIDRYIHTYTRLKKHYKYQRSSEKTYPMHFQANCVQIKLAVYIILY